MEIQKSINNQTDFSIKLATHLLSKKFQNSNVFFSPISIHVVLSLLAAGFNGETLNQLLAFLKTSTANELNSLYSRLVPLIFADGSPNGGPRLAFANGVWVDETLFLKPSFEHVADKVYKAACNLADFQTKKAINVAKEVNLWAEKQTNGLIKLLLPANAVSELTRLIFANALYFKGAWSQKFTRSDTKESHFHLLDGSKVRVPFMTNNKLQFVRQHDDFKVLGLRYLKRGDERQFTMYFFLPNANDGLPSLIEKIGSTCDFFKGCIPREKVEVRKFLIPKFKISFGFEASDVLKELGLVLPFGRFGDGLTEMVDDLDDGKELYVSSIHHKSSVEVNEDGTEAAAVSWGQMGILSCKMPRKVDFVADHPFLFVIREDVTGVVLFMGQVINPSCLG